MYTHTCTPTRTHIHTCSQIYVFTHTHIQTHTHTHTHKHTSTHTHTHTHTHIHTHIHHTHHMSLNQVFLSNSIHLSIHLYIYKSIHPSIFQSIQFNSKYVTGTETKHLHCQSSSNSSFDRLVVVNKGNIDDSRGRSELIKQFPRIESDANLNSTLVVC